MTKRYVTLTLTSLNIPLKRVPHLNILMSIPTTYSCSNISEMNAQLTHVTGTYERLRRQ
ncbi:hypothetical protein BDR07DRAFT_699134 [Suillus spraguei]|nr:hypothetical protein BDR07DRAFT_699134 [Suillus spraguei]